MYSQQFQSSRSAQGRLLVACQCLLEALESRLLLSAIPAPLMGADIGTPAGGSDSYDSNTGIITVTGAGHDIIGGSDAFHYVYEPLDGDGTITVKIDSDSANSGESLAGLDIRTSLLPDAANVFVARGTTDRSSSIPARSTPPPAETTTPAKWAAFPNFYGSHARRATSTRPTRLITE